MKFRIGSTVWILDSKKPDGRYNKGKVVGYETSYRGLGFISEKDYFNGFGYPSYKVAYVDVFTGRGGVVWCSEDNIQKEKPCT